VSVADFYAQQAVNGRAILSMSRWNEPLEWISRVEGTYYRCHAEAIGVKEVQPTTPLEALGDISKYPIRSLTEVLH